ncbi:benzoate/H(+) symporter BenE family transporter [Gemmobacter fulvus]|uniref:benzoate/H(+) symporter BenE family transporter n=1 Tax=Gemmobacter fulvus TaxID=2840474 RepID=UPI00279680F4|nr:benzoate/H(+) symporter BenE family transporter [Gemmobacter fulvus]MDQ1849555.1 benzoate/H(+) symporter BenE family transporter [Gemmobacter fulvus]
MRASLFSAALVAALVGYGSTIALVLAAAAAVGASPAQTGSWVLAICLGKAAGSALLSVSSRVPVVLAWSTPGAALIAATEGVTMPQAVGAFVLTGLLIALTGTLKPLGRLVARIPDSIAAGMLAGVLLPFCLKLPAATQGIPALILPVIGLFALVRLRNPALAVLAALALGLAAAFASGLATLPPLRLPLPQLTFILPEFDPMVLIGLALPLYLVTMASQNLPGFATLRAAGYEPPVRAGLTVTGGISALIGLFGAHTISMAAITAAICLGDDVHPDRNRRWQVGLVYAAIWVGLGLLGPLILSLLAALPPELITAIVALALLGPFMGAATAAFQAPETRFAAAITLVVTASGAPALGIGAAFWGLLAGLAFHTAEQLRRPTA